MENNVLFLYRPCLANFTVYSTLFLLPRIKAYGNKYSHSMLTSFMHLLAFISIPELSFKFGRRKTFAAAQILECFIVIMITFYLNGKYRKHNYLVIQDIFRRHIFPLIYCLSSGRCINLIFKSHLPGIFKFRILSVSFLLQMFFPSCEF